MATAKSGGLRRARADLETEELTGKELLELMQAKTMGAPISLETIHRLMRDRNLSELTFEDELALIKQEEPIIGGPGVPGEANHDDEEDQDDRQAA